MTTSSLKILLLSDLHAFSSVKDGDAAANSPSYLEIEKLATEPHFDPFNGLKAIYGDLQPVDLVLCAGDMGDKGSPEGIIYAWSKIQALTSDLGAKFSVATVGNHDIDSRYKYDKHDHQKAIKGLYPRFPGLNDTDCDKFWSRHFTIVIEPEWRIVLLNSCAFHGGGSAPGDEYQSGRVSTGTLSEIRREVDAQGAKSLNILVCHHHPIRNNEIVDEDYSEMQGGDSLLHELGEWNVGPWVVVHGHRHLPRVLYAQGNSSSPIVFSAGSFSAKLYPELAARARNQIYLIEFPIGRFAELGIDVGARGKAWDWISSRGWIKSRPDSGFPSEYGFGRRLQFNTDVPAVATFVKSKAPGYITRAELLVQFPWLDFVLPTDQQRLLARLAADGVHATFDGDGKIAQIGVR